MVQLGKYPYSGGKKWQLLVKVKCVFCGNVFKEYKYTSTRYLRREAVCPKCGWRVPIERVNEG